MDSPHGAKAVVHPLSPVVSRCPLLIFPRSWNCWSWSCRSWNCRSWSCRSWSCWSWSCHAAKSVVHPLSPVVSHCIPVSPGCLPFFPRCLSLSIRELFRYPLPCHHHYYFVLVSRVSRGSSKGRLPANFLQHFLKPSWGGGEIQVSRVSRGRSRQSNVKYQSFRSCFKGVKGVNVCQVLSRVPKFVEGCQGCQGLSMVVKGVKVFLFFFFRNRPMVFFLKHHITIAPPLSSPWLPEGRVTTRPKGWSGRVLRVVDLRGPPTPLAQVQFKNR